MLKKIYRELVLIRKELQAIRNDLKPKKDESDAIDFLTPRDIR